MATALSMSVVVVYRQRADTRSRDDIWKWWSQIVDGFGTRHCGCSQDLEMCLYCRVKLEWHNTSWRIHRSEAGADTACLPRVKKAHTMSRVLAACRRLPQTECSWVTMERQSPFQLAVTWLRRKSTRAQRVVHKSSESDNAERPRTWHHWRQTRSAHTSQPKSCTKKSPVGDSNANGSTGRAKPNHPKKDPCNRGLRRTTDRCLKWLVRHAAWTLTTFHVGSNGMTAHQRISGKPINQKIAAFGEQIQFKPHKTTGAQQKLAVKWLDGYWLSFNTRTGRNIVSNNVAVVSCRSIQKRNKEERSNLEMLLGILGNPWVEVDPHTAAPARYIPTVNPEMEAGPIVTKNPEMERMADASSSRRRLCLSSERPGPSLRGTVARLRPPDWIRHESLWGSCRWAHNMWRRTCSPGDPTPQRQSTYHKEGEEQKEVLEAKDDEEKKSELDGEVEKRERERERESHSTCAWDMAMTVRWDETQDLSPWAHLSHSVMCKESNEDDTEETLQNKQTKGTHESSVGVLVRVLMLQVCVHVKHVVVFVVLRIRVIISIIVKVATYSLLPALENFVNCSHCENGSVKVLSLHTLSVAVDRRQL